MNEQIKALVAGVTTKRDAQIKLLGDSITHGVGGTGFIQNGEPIVENFRRNPDGYCWANSFRDYMHDKYGAKVINNACTGTTIQFVLKHFDTLVDKDDDLVICTIGTNNRHQMFGTGEKKSREEMAEIFYSSLILLIKKFEELGKDVIFVANIPAAKRNERDSDQYWRILHMDDINNLYKKAQDECDFNLISLYDLFSEYCTKESVEIDELLGDGLHPNDKGYDVMLELIKSALGV